MRDLEGPLTANTRRSAKGPERPLSVDEAEHQLLLPPVDPYGFDWGVWIRYGSRGVFVGILAHPIGTFPLVA